MSAHAIAPTRRGVVAGLALAPLAVAAGVSAAPCQNREAWDATFGRCQVAKATEEAAERHLQEVYRLIGEGPPKPDIGELRKVFAFRSEQEILQEVDMEAGYRWEVNNQDKSWWSLDPEARLARVRSACDRVIQYRADCAALEGEHDLSGAIDRSEAAVNQLCDIEHELMAIPAPHGEALRWKLDRLFGDDQNDDDSLTPWAVSFVSTFFEDVRRLSAMLDGEA